MIPFKPIELEDKATVQRYTLKSKRVTVTSHFPICIAGDFCIARRLLN